MTFNTVINNIEVGIALEQFTRGGKGKFFIPALTPILSNSAPYNTQITSGATSNIVNKVSLPISNITTSNYIELYVPDYVCEELPKVPLTNERIISKGAQVQIIFTGGDITRPRVIAAYV